MNERVLKRKIYNILKYNIDNCKLLIFSSNFVCLQEFAFATQLFQLQPNQFFQFINNTSNPDSALNMLRSAFPNISSRDALYLCQSWLAIEIEENTFDIISTYDDHSSYETKLTELTERLYSILQEHQIVEVVGEYPEYDQKMDKTC